MKTNRYLCSTLLACAGLFLACPAAKAQTASDLIFNTFGSASETSNWAHWWGSATTDFQWDSTRDASNNVSSGSLHVTVGWGPSSDPEFSLYGIDQQGTTSLTANPVDGTLYTNLVFDILWDTTSPSPGGTYGNLEIGLTTSSYGQIWIGNWSPPADGLWHHVVFPINPTIDGLSGVSGMVAKMWSPANTAAAIPGNFWLDNVKLIAKLGPPPPPPSVKLEKVTATGLRLVSTTADGGNVREGIHTVYPCSWVGSATPVTYSVTITNYPDSTHPNLQTHIFLAPGNALPYGPGDSSVDWNATNLIFIQIQNHANGTAGATFMYKTNVTGTADRWAGQIFGSNTLASINAPGIVGTWSVTFVNDTNITITVPGGASTNFFMPAESAAMFADPLYAVFGMQPNNSGNVGQPVTFAHVKIDGSAGPVDEGFTTAPLDLFTWGLTAGNALGVRVVPPDSAYWLTWTLPDIGFSLQATTNVSDPDSWADPGLSSYSFDGRRRMLLPVGNLPGTSAGFFRLVKPQ